MVTQVVFGNMPTETVSQTHHANNMLLLISADKDIIETDAKPKISAKTAFHHHAQLDRPAKTSAELLTSRNTMSRASTASQEKKR